jgi:hypothetical protein
LLLSVSCENSPIRFGSPGDLPARSFISRIGDKEIQFGLTDTEIMKFPSWSPKLAPPIPTSEVIEIAEKELPKVTHGTQGWYVRGISIEQVRRSSDGNDKWIYLVSFGGIGDGDYVQLPVTFSGTPVKGVERPLSKDHH